MATSIHGVNQANASRKLKRRWMTSALNAPRGSPLDFAEAATGRNWEGKKSKFLRYRVGTNPIAEDRESEKMITPTPARKAELLKDFFANKLQAIDVRWAAEMEALKISATETTPAWSKHLQKLINKKLFDSVPGDKLKAIATYRLRWIAGMKAKSNAYKQILAQMSSAAAKGDAMDAYLRKFHMFLRGQPAPQDQAKLAKLGMDKTFTSLTHYSEVDEYLRAFSKIRADYYKDLAMLKMRGPGSTLKEIEIYYKYIIDGNDMDKIERNLWEWLEGGKLTKNAERTIELKPEETMSGRLQAEFPVGNAPPTTIAAGVIGGGGGVLGAGPPSPRTNEDRLRVQRQAIAAEAQRRNAQAAAAATQSLVTGSPAITQELEDELPLLRKRDQRSSAKTLTITNNLSPYERRFVPPLPLSRPIPPAPAPAAATPVAAATQAMLNQAAAAARQRRAEATEEEDAPLWSESDQRAAAKYVPSPVLPPPQEQVAAIAKQVVAEQKEEEEEEIPAATNVNVPRSALRKQPDLELPTNLKRGADDTTTDSAARADKKALVTAPEKPPGLELTEREKSILRHQANKLKKKSGTPAPPQQDTTAEPETTTQKIARGNALLEAALEEDDPELPYNLKRVADDTAEEPATKTQKKALVTAPEKPPDLQLTEREKSLIRHQANKLKKKSGTPAPPQQDTTAEPETTAQKIARGTALMEAALEDDDLELPYSVKRAADQERLSEEVQKEEEETLAREAVQIEQMVEVAEDIDALLAELAAGEKEEEEEEEETPHRKALNQLAQKRQQSLEKRPAQNNRVVELQQQEWSSDTAADTSIPIRARLRGLTNPTARQEQVARSQWRNDGDAMEAQKTITKRQREDQEDDAFYRKNSAGIDEAQGSMTKGRLLEQWVAYQEGSVLARAKAIAEQAKEIDMAIARKEITPEQGERMMKRLGKRIKVDNNEEEEEEMEEDDFINNTVVKPRKAPKSGRARQLEIRQTLNRGRRAVALVRAAATVPQQPPVSQVDNSNQEAAALEAEETAILEDELRMVQAHLQQEMEAHGIKRRTRPADRQSIICKQALVYSKMRRLDDDDDEPPQKPSTTTEQPPKEKRCITPTLLSTSVSGKSENGEKKKKKKNKGKEKV